MTARPLLALAALAVGIALSLLAWKLREAPVVPEGKPEVAIATDAGSSPTTNPTASPVLPAPLPPDRATESHARGAAPEAASSDAGTLIRDHRGEEPTPIPDPPTEVARAVEEVRGQVQLAVTHCAALRRDTQPAENGKLFVNLTLTSTGGKAMPRSVGVTPSSPALAEERDFVDCVKQGVSGLAVDVQKGNLFDQPVSITVAVP
ncbi:MAG: hypothetical protein HY698_04845 [Deltaproteobacteria bacterium]|nr:hypothetical protein [Deltaproteobacteria bacterium]